MSSYINQFIQRDIQAQLSTPVFLAYSACERILAEFPILKGPLQQNCLSDLKQVMVEHEMQRLIVNGTIPNLRCKIANNSRKTHPFLELVGDNFIATISHVQKSYSIPQYSCFRNERAASNQISIFDEDNKDPDKFYFIITHGHLGIQPDFVCIGLPDYENKYWIEHSNILHLPYIVPTKHEYEESLVSLTTFAKEVLKNEENGKG